MPHKLSSHLLEQARAIYMYVLVSSPTGNNRQALPASIASIPLLPLTATAGASLTITSPSTPTSSLPSALGVQPLKMSAVVASSTPTALVFSFASSFPLIPGKLVHNIQSLEFIEMRDLLPDNIALAKRLEALPTHWAPFKTPETREVGALSTWVSAFCTYVAVVAAAHPGRVRYMLAYMRLIVREAQKYGGSRPMTKCSIATQLAQGHDGTTSIPRSILPISLLKPAHRASHARYVVR